LPRRAFLQGMLGGAAAAAAGNLGTAGAARASGPPEGTGYQDAYNELASEDSTRSIPFYGRYQAGIATPPQIVADFLSFDVTAANRRELIDLLRTLTERAAFLTHGGTPPPSRPGRASEHRYLLGATVLPDDLTVTVALGASLFDDRYGLASRKPAQLKMMRAFTHDQLDPKLTHGDLLVQLCANHRDTVGNAMLDLVAHTRGGMRLRWRMPAVRFPPRPVGIPRDWMGFKDGITNPNTDDAAQMSQVVWVQRGGPEPAWTASGTYQVVRIIRMHMEQWDKVPVAHQERIFGRRKISGAPLYATDPNASDELDPVYTNDPQGLLTPLRCHIRLANPQTPQTKATSSILRRSYQYDRSPDEGAQPDVGHTFCCFQQKLGTYIAMQNRLEKEMLVPYITPIGGGYFFAVPGVRDARDYHASGLLRGLRR
jgi:deferrochelatase/peroxidase EfeB